MISTGLPRAGYTIPEIEKLLGIAPKMGYRLVNNDKIKAFKGLDGKLRVSEMELYMYMREKNNITNK